MISERIKSARQTLQEVRSEMSGLLKTAADDFRTLNEAESSVYDALEETAKHLEGEIASLDASLAAQAAMARPPRKEWD